MTGSSEYPVPLTEKQVAARRHRSIAIALALGALVLLFYAATIVRMGGNVANRPLAVTGVGLLKGVLR